MEIQVQWRTPVGLAKAPRDIPQDFIVHEDDERRIPTRPGVYVFARAYGPHYEPLYIGQADDLRARIKQHLKTNVALMRALRESKSGAKVILLGELKLRPGQQKQRVLDIVEPTLIAEAVASGYALVNRQLTSAKFHSMVSTGPTRARGPFLRTYRVPVK